MICWLSDCMVCFWKFWEDVWNFFYFLIIGSNGIRDVIIKEMKVICNKDEWVEWNWKIE